MRSTKPRGSYVEIDPPSTQPDSPDGLIYIVWAVTRIIGWFSCPGRVPWTPAVALNLLTKAGRLGEFRGARFDGRHNKRENRRLKPSDWDDIQFGAPGQACLLVAGQNVGLHGVLIPAHDFDYWLEEGPAEKLVASLSESTAGPQDAAARAQPAKKTRGPTPGTNKQFHVSDTNLHPEIDSLVGAGISVEAAARKLAEDGKVSGRGSENSNRGHRLAKSYRAAKKLDPTRSY